MIKFIQNLFKPGKNKTIQLPDRTSFSFKGHWTGVQYGTVIDQFHETVIDQFHVGDFSSAIYMIVAEFDSNEKEVMQLSVVARPGEATASIFGRSSINQELITLSVTVDDSIVKIKADPKSSAYAGTKIQFHATYAQTIHQLSAPALIVADSTEEASGINTFDATTETFDVNDVTFDKV